MDETKKVFKIEIIYNIKRKKEKNSIKYSTLHYVWYN